MSGLSPGDWDEITRDATGREIRRVSIHVDEDGSEWVCHAHDAQRGALWSVWRDLHETTACAVRIREQPGTPWWRFWGEQRAPLFILERCRRRASR